MTEEQAYDLLAEYPEFELRRYPEHLVAEIEVGGPFELAGNLAFPRLARYIGGHNRSSRKVAMTAPVVQQQAPDSRHYLVGFVMPADVSAENLPDPSDSAVRTRRVPAETAAALRFSGRWSRSTYEKRTVQLLAALEAAGLDVVGDPRFARFDPPWTPSFLRRNEVVVAIADEPARRDMRDVLEAIDQDYSLNTPERSRIHSAVAPDTGSRRTERS